MKKVLLVGDSIRKGYCNYVKEKLAGECEVYFDDENCRFGEYILRYLHGWCKSLGLSGDVDLVHFNTGLWDVLEMFGDEPLTTPDYYENVLVRIVKRIRMLFPEAKIVFALTTSVDESQMSPVFLRRNSVIKEYNRIAVESLTPLGVSFNDMYSVTEGCDPECRSDGVHFNNPRGEALTGDAVLSCIRRELSL